jgi:hypothetical protein
MALEVAPLAEHELPAADRIFRLAFGTFKGLPDPAAFAGDTDYVGTRWRADPGASLGARRDGALLGSNFGARWGSLATFGPLSVHPERWGERVAQALLDPTMALFERWGVAHAGLFTFSSSPKHLALYQKYDFWPGSLTAILALGVRAGRPRPGAAGRLGEGAAAERLSRIAAQERPSVLHECRDLTGSALDGLDLALEIESVARSGIGDVLLARGDGGRLDALAVCHVGPGSEAGSGCTYVKFGAARSGRGAADRFARLLDACELLAIDRGTPRLVAGVSTARVEAYRMLLARGFRTEILGVAMHRGGDPAYNRPGTYLIDDWR